MMHNALPYVKKLLSIVIGCTMIAIGMSLFVLPSGLITGGTTGIALVVQHLFQVPVSITVAVVNVVMFLLGALILGKEFALTTILSTFLYPFLLGVMGVLAEKIGPLSQDLMLCTIFAGVLIGAGIALVISAGASTGGMDIPPLIINKKTGISVSVLLYVFDVLILSTQAVFVDMEQILYGILLVCIYSIALDQLLVAGKSKVEIQVISNRYEEINEAILKVVDRGTTLLKAEGGYTRHETYTIMTVVSRRELFRVNELVRSIDPEAFLIVGSVNEVRGRGFTIKKKEG